MAIKFFGKRPRQPRETAADQSGPSPLTPDTEESDQKAPSAEASSPSEEDRHQQAPSSTGFYQRLRNGLAKTRQIFTTDIDQLFGPGKQLSPDTLDDLEERLITADIGVRTAMEIFQREERKE